MPTGERDAHPRAQTGPPVPRAYEELQHLTPPPITITAEMAWEHSTHVAQRTANALSEIAHSSGVGMKVADEIAECRSDAVQLKKTLRWWQALVLAALGAAGSALFGVARGLYSSGEKSGIVEMRLQSCERQAERNGAELLRLRDMYTELLRDRPRQHRNPQPESSQ
jgi:hypothetical protein